MSGDNFTAAMANRSRRTVETELKFLAELSEITPQQLSSILGLLAGEQSRQLSQPQPPQPAPVPLPVQQTAPPPPIQQPIVPPPAPYSPPTNQFSNTSLNEKAPVQQHPPPPGPPPGPPPAYGAPGVLCTATALYAFEVKDHGDLELQPYDKIQVLRYENDQWWYGRNVRTNKEGIFPRAWVNVIQDKDAPAPTTATNYGNMPLEVSQSGSAPPGPEGDGKGNKFEQHGKKFGKKMGNAAIFGAGATMGSNIVNSIF